MKVVFLDIETTGVNTFKDSIIVIGFKELDSNVNQIFGYSERELLTNFYNYLRSLDPLDTIICGWKIRRFDIPFIRARSFIRAVCNLILRIDKFEILDLADIIEKYMVVDGQPIHSQDVLDSLGIRSVDKINGADVPSLYKVGGIEEILKHNKEDLKVTEKLFYRLNMVWNWIDGGSHESRS